MNDIRIIIAGSREFNRYETVKIKVKSVLSKLEIPDDKDKITIVSGTARGADKLGETLAIEKGYHIKRFNPRWDVYGKSAGIIRNKEMAEFASKGELGILIAFWNGKSRGTANMIDEAHKNNLEVFVEPFKKIITW